MFLVLPLGLLRLLKPCKVKRFLATEDRSVVGLVTPSSGGNGLKWEAEQGGEGEHRANRAMEMKMTERNRV